MPDHVRRGEFHFVNGVNYRLIPYTVEEGIKDFNCFGYGNEWICRYETNPDEFMLIRNGGGRERNYIIRTNSSDDWGDLHAVATKDDVKHSLSKLLKSDMTSKANIFSLVKDVRMLQSQVLCLLKKEDGCLDQLLMRMYNVRELPKRHNEFLICPKETIQENMENGSNTILNRRVIYPRSPF
ncbi:hypothetical protein GE061_007748 [Apolygus lucorum]|uniref:Uncharacterized protein n=1 Tax=Apolygus lucorum TaxID=248454 RepID=A0A8S9WMM2_APOLU|nr:hypothetical protein GE061_007748 [Apolygus lucorum]